MIPPRSPAPSENCPRVPRRVRSWAQTAAVTCLSGIAMTYWRDSFCRGFRSQARRYMSKETEIQAVVERYARRSQAGQSRYEMHDPAVWQVALERQQAVIRLLARQLHVPIGAATLLEIGCGSGMNLLEFLRIGFRPGNLVGNELLPDRLSRARGSLPELIRLPPGGC